MLEKFSDWVIIIYRNLYHPHNFVADIAKLDSVFETITSTTIYAAIVNVILILGISIMLVYFFTDLMEKATTHMLSIKQMFLAFLKLVLVVLLMYNASTFMNHMVQFGDAVANDMTMAVSESEDWFSDSNNLEKYKDCVRSLSDITQIGYAVKFLVPYLVSLVTEIVFYTIMLSRIVELTVRFVFAPIAIADAFNDTRSSTAIRYMKKILALSLQFAVAVGISLAVNEMIKVLTVGADAIITIPDPAVCFKTKTTTASIDGGYALSGMVAADTNKVQEFLSMMCGGPHYWLCLGLSITKIYMLFKSQSLSNDVVGV